MIAASNAAPRLNRTKCMHVYQAEDSFIVQHFIQLRYTNCRRGENSA